MKGKAQVTREREAREKKASGVVASFISLMRVSPVL